MHKRATPRDIPDRYPYMRIELPDVDPHHMQIPSHLAVAKMVKAFDALHVAALYAMSQKATAQNMLGIFKDSGPEIGALMGALIGKSWARVEWDLDTTPAPDLLAYGEAVWEELHAEGYTLETLVLLSLTLIRAIWEQSQFSDEVSKRASFFYPMKAPANSSGLTLGSSTSAIHTDSEN